MKITQLISELQKMKEIHGDVEVGHEIGSDEFPFEYIEYIKPVYRKDKNCREDKSLPVDFIELI